MRRIDHGYAETTDTSHGIRERNLGTRWAVSLCGIRVVSTVQPFHPNAADACRRCAAIANGRTTS